MNSSARAMQWPYLGLVISAATLLAFIAWTAFIWPWANPPAPPAFDEAWAHGMKDAAGAHAHLRAVFIFFTVVGGIPALSGLAIVGAFGLAWAGQRRLALTWAVAVVGGALLNLGIKELVDRERPRRDIRDVFVHEDNESYPSGHSMGSTIGLGMLAYAGWRVLRRRTHKIPLTAGVIVTIGLVGLSRIFLRAHWLSDVIAGFLIGASWLFFCISWLELFERRARQAALPTTDH